MNLKKFKRELGFDFRVFDEMIEWMIGGVKYGMNSVSEVIRKEVELVFFERIFVRVSVISDVFGLVFIISLCLNHTKNDTIYIKFFVYKECEFFAAELYQILNQYLLGFYKSLIDHG